MHDYIVTSPFVERLADGGMKNRTTGEHITDEAEIEALTANGNPHHIQRIPTTRAPEESKADLPSYPVED